MKNFAILAIFFSPCLVSGRVTNVTESSIFDGYNLFANNSTTTTTTTTATPDEFDDFFDSIDATEPPTLEDKINNFASAIELTHDLATELKNQLTNNSNDKEPEMLAVRLHDLTGTLSSMIESLNASFKCSGSTMASSTIPSEISSDDCGLAEFVTANRMKINLPYDDNMDCEVTLKLSQTRTFKLTIDKFRVSLTSYFQ